MSAFDAKTLDKLVKSLASSVIKETLSPLQVNESELARQRRAARAQAPFKKNESPKDNELEEAEDEEKQGEKKDEKKPAEKPSKDPDSKPKELVSKKIALGKEEPKQPKAVIPDPSEIKDVTFGQVVNMMNMMRSGKSAKDPEIKTKLSAYFKGLNSGERQALFVLLSGLTQILAAGVEGDDAPDPSEVGIKIQPKQSDKDTPAAKSDNRTSPTAAPATKPSGAPAEGMPIVVGEAADRSRIRLILDRIGRPR